jgi:hypothetical protein
VSNECGFGSFPDKNAKDFTLGLEDPPFLTKTNPVGEVDIITKILSGKVAEAVRLPGRKSAISIRIKGEMLSHITRQFEHEQ